MPVATPATYATPGPHARRSRPAGSSWILRVNYLPRSQWIARRFGKARFAVILAEFTFVRMDPKRYPRQLSRGANNAVIVLSEAEVGKLFSDDTRSDIGSEAEKLRYANGINELVVKFIRLEYNTALAADMLVMERLYPLDYRAYEVEMRELWLDVFSEELGSLHAAGFVHRDLLRPSNITGDRYDNILLTPRGLRLIDVGISVLQRQVGESFFTAYVQREQEELAVFRQFFLAR